jgi:hypothetical protein
MHRSSDVFGADMYTFANQQPPDIQALFSQFLAQLPAAQIEQITDRKSDGFPDIRIESRSHVKTAIAAHWLGRQEQTLRGWACLENGPLRPIRVSGKLAWAVADIRRLLGV